MKVLGQNTVPLRYDKKYTDRLKFISHLASIYHKEEYIDFIPSIEIRFCQKFSSKNLCKPYFFYKNYKNLISPLICYKI